MASIKATDIGTSSSLSILSNLSKVSNILDYINEQMAMDILGRVSGDLTEHMSQEVRNETLCSLIKQNKFEQAKHLLDNGATFVGHEYVVSDAAECSEWSNAAFEFLIDNGAPRVFGNNDKTVLHAATSGNNYDKVKYLVSSGIGSVVINYKNYSNNTPLSECLCVNGKQTDKRIIRLLVEKGAELNATGGYHTPAEMIEEYFGIDFLSSLSTKTIINTPAATVQTSSTVTQ